MANTEFSRLVWRKSSYSTSGNCVEVAIQDEVVHIRDSKNPNLAVLSIPSSSWLEFIQTIQGYHTG